MGGRSQSNIVNRCVWNYLKDRNGNEHKGACISLEGKSCTIKRQKWIKFSSLLQCDDGYNCTAIFDPAKILSSKNTADIGEVGMCRVSCGGHSAQDCMECRRGDNSYCNGSCKIESVNGNYVCVPKTAPK